MLINDSAPNYTSSEFKGSLRSCSTKHITSSPHYSQSIGKAEAAVKIMKNIGLVKKNANRNAEIYS